MSHATRADKLLIKPTAGARRPDDSLRRHENGLTPDESQAARTTPPWQRPLTDRPADSHRRLIRETGSAGDLACCGQGDVVVICRSATAVARWRCGRFLG